MPTRTGFLTSFPLEMMREFLCDVLDLLTHLASVCLLGTYFFGRKLESEM
jgi:hypothetical protein